MKSVVFDCEAKAEFDAAATYDEAQRPGLGDDFVAEVEQAVQRIAQKGRTAELAVGRKRAVAKD